MTKPSVRSKEEQLEIANEQLQTEVRTLRCHIAASTTLTDHLELHPVSAVLAAKNAVAKKLEARILKAFSEFDETDILRTIEERITNEALMVTDKLLGIDRKWSAPEIKNGRIADLIGPAVDELLQDKLRPLVLAEIARLLETQTFKKSMNAAIRERASSAIRSIAYGSNNIGNQIDALVKKELDSVFEEYTNLTA
jgi:hypothetical protein